MQQQQLIASSKLSTESSSSSQPLSGLEKLAAQLEQEDASPSNKQTKVHIKKPVKYASGMWITSASASASGPTTESGSSSNSSSRRKRSIGLEAAEKAAAAAMAATGSVGRETGPRYLHHHNSPWKRRNRMSGHSSSTTSTQSEKHHHVPSVSTLSSSTTAAGSNPFAAMPADMAEPLTGHLRATGHDMAMHMMKKRRMNGGRMYDVPQIGKSYTPY